MENYYQSQPKKVRLSYEAFACYSLALILIGAMFTLKCCTPDYKSDTVITNETKVDSSKITNITNVYQPTKITHDTSFIPEKLSKHQIDSILIAYSDRKIDTQTFGEAGNYTLGITDTIQYNGRTGRKVEFKNLRATSITTVAPIPKEKPKAFAGFMYTTHQDGKPVSFNPMVGITYKSFLLTSSYGVFDGNILIGGAYKIKLRK